MSRVMLGALVGVGLWVLPAGAAPFDALFHHDLSTYTTMDDLPLNGPFLGTVARQKAYWATRYPSERELVVPGGKGQAAPQEVNVGGLIVQPGARLPLSLREIIITGNSTERITVVSKPKGQ
jgi:hypothetical protein